MGTVFVKKCSESVERITALDNAYEEISEELEYDIKRCFLKTYQKEADRLLQELRELLK